MMSASMCLLFLYCYVTECKPPLGLFLIVWICCHFHSGFWDMSREASLVDEGGHSRTVKLRDESISARASSQETGVLDFKLLDMYISQYYTKFGNFVESWHYATK